MKTIIAGSRAVQRISILEDAIEESGFVITEVVSGKEPEGADRLGEIWAEDHGIQVDPYPADWDRFGKAAGRIRNRKMATESGATHLLALLQDGSPGTTNMIREAKAQGLEVYVKKVIRAVGPWDHLVVHCKLAPYDVYIGRRNDPNTLKPGKWGNDWSHIRGAGLHWVRSVEEAVNAHKASITPEMEAMIKEELRGKVLGCWCRKKGYELCHGLTLAEIANSQE